MSQERWSKARLGEEVQTPRPSLAVGEGDAELGVRLRPAC